MRLRTVRADDLPRVIELNEGAVPHVNSLPREQFEAFAERAFCFLVAEVEGAVEGFLVALTPESDYASPNFLWFKERRPSFVYIDRVVVADSARRRGIGRRLYDDLERLARRAAPILTCEVNLRPANEASLLFHQRFGFAQVGTQQTEAGSKEVSLMEKRLADSLETRSPARGGRGASFWHRAK